MKIPFSVYDFFGYLSSGYVILAVSDLAFGDGWLVGSTPTVSTFVFLLVVAYVIGHIVAHISSAVLEHVVLRKALKSPEVHLLEPKDVRGWKRLFPGHFRALPVATIDRISARAKEHGVATSGRSFFFHCHPLVKKDEATRERLASFLNQYGFCRNISMALLVSVFVLVSGAIVDKGRFDDTNLLIGAGLLLFGAIAMFYRYLKFFRHYTLEVFMTYAELASPRGRSES